MMAKAVARAAAMIALLPLLSACGDMDDMFPSSDSHRVRASVSGVSLEGGASIIRSGDEIFPYFAVSVAGDPDLTGLLAYLRGARGEIAGSRIRHFVGAEGEASGAEGEILVALRSFAQELPAFSLPEGLELGAYTLVFEALRGRGVLRRTEIPVFYIGDAEFSLRDISMALPGIFATRLIPPGTKALLEAGLDFDSRLDPHLTWSGGRGIISQGLMRDGAGSVLWEAPGHAAMHPLRLEILPFEPFGSGRGLSGISREIVLPVSAAAESPGFFFGAEPGHPARSRLAAGPGRELLAWHTFEGRLGDLAAQGEERLLEPAGGGAPRWASVGQVYGLATGAGDAFAPRPVGFLRGDQSRGGGAFLFHISSLADGAIFSASFPSLAPACEGARLGLFREGNAIALRIGAANEAAEIRALLGCADLRGFVPVSVEFCISPGRLEARVGFDLAEGGFLQSAALGVALPAPLTGEAQMRLGGEPPDWPDAPLQAFAELGALSLRPYENGGAGAESGADAAGDGAVDGEGLDGAGEGLGEGCCGQAEARGGFAATAVWSEFAVVLLSEPFSGALPAAAESRPGGGGAIEAAAGGEGSGGGLAGADPAQEGAAGGNAAAALALSF